jgi:alpha-galactosidase/6-phospho-beta-glucosidase family protein
LERVSPFDPEKARRQYLEGIEEKFRNFIEASKHPETIEWSDSINRSGLFAIDSTDISVSIFKALAGLEKMRIVASMPNKNAVIKNLPENVAAEFTMDIFKNTITPAADQYVPAPFQGLTASLAEFQTLLADCIAENDPKLFAAAIDSYPVNRFEPKRKEFLQKMFDIYTDVDPVMRKAVDYIW